MGRNLLTDKEWTVFAPFLTEAMSASGLWDVLLQALASTPTGSRERVNAAAIVHQYAGAKTHHG